MPKPKTTSMARKNNNNNNNNNNNDDDEDDDDDDDNDEDDDDDDDDGGDDDDGNKKNKNKKCAWMGGIQYVLERTAQRRVESGEKCLQPFLLHKLSQVIHLPFDAVDLANLLL